MAKRTRQTGLPHWEDAEDLGHLVKDKRTGKRGTPAKARRRNRRYENRILRSQIDEIEDDEPLADTPEEDEEFTELEESQVTDPLAAQLRALEIDPSEV